jgi:acyl-CoA thioester hydrolase
MKKIIFNLEVYTYQIDFIGHVNNSVYHQWMEIGRTKLLEAVGLPIHEIANRGIFPVLVHTDISFKTPLYLGDNVQLELWISELRQASAIMNFCFYNGEGILAASAHQKGLFIDRETKRPRRLQPEERKLFHPFLFLESGTNLVSSK